MPINSLCSITRLGKLAGLALLLACIGLPDPALAGPAAKPKACTATAKNARAACEFSAADDYQIAIGICTNITDKADRADCLAEAKQDRRDQGPACREEFAARREVCGLIGEGPYDPDINPGDFLDKAGILAQPNPLFPLVPGRTYVYRNGDEEIRTTTTNQTKEILGVTVMVVSDVSRINGQLSEQTEDWFAQDLEGNVWYFGEISQQYEDGELVSIDGSWKAGVNGAKPGIVMEAAPVVNDTYRQEFALGDAEDMGQVLKTNGSALTPGGSCSHTCLVTRDFSALDPGVDENKYYAPNVGLILTIEPETGAREELIQIINTP